MENSVAVRLQYDELLFYAACVSHCWSMCLCVCVCLQGRVFRRRAAGGGMRLGSSWRWQLSRAMRLALRLRRLCRPQEGGGRVGVRLSAAWRYGKLLLRSLYYNSLTNSDTLLDCAFEPVYWIVDNVTRWFGVVSSLFQPTGPDSALVSLQRLSFPRTPPGVCVPGGPADVLCGDHHLPVRLTNHLLLVLRSLDRLASLLRPLAAHPGGLPLLQGHHHLPRTPTQGTTSTIKYRTSQRYSVVTWQIMIRLM